MRGSVKKLDVGKRESSGCVFPPVPLSQETRLVSSVPLLLGKQGVEGLADFQGLWWADLEPVSHKSVIN